MQKTNWESLTIQSNFIFGKVIETSPTFCKWLLEKILGFEIDEIQYPEREKVVETTVDGKGIRLDVFVQSADGRKSYDIEMQVANRSDLPKRMRYYQGQLDNDALDKGKYYWELGETYIIFICPFDYFGRGRHIYTFRECCVEDKELFLKTGVTKIILNANGRVDDVNNDLLAFLDYVAGKNVNHPVISELDKRVSKIKHNKKWRGEYMMLEQQFAAELHWRVLEATEEFKAEYMEEVRDEVLAKGRAEGLVEGKATGEKSATLKNLKALMLSLNVDADKAMSILQIPAEDRSEYLNQLG